MPASQHQNDRILVFNTASMQLALRLLQLPGAQGMDAATVATLGQACLDCGQWAVFKPVLGLRGSLELSVAQVRPWLHHAVCVQDPVVLGKLTKLPAVVEAGAATERPGVPSSSVVACEVRAATAVLGAGDFVGSVFD